ncbi:unnamed protein product [Gadus morhua 'NCC']
MHERTPNTLLFPIAAEWGKTPGPGPAQDPRTQTGPRPPPDRPQTAPGPPPDRPRTAPRPAPDRPQTGEKRAGGGRGPNRLPGQANWRNTENTLVLRQGKGRRWARRSRYRGQREGGGTEPEGPCRLAPAPGTLMSLGPRSGPHGPRPDEEHTK